MCQVCGRHRHTALKCYRRFDHSYQGDEASSMAAYTVASSGQPDLSWYPDTAAANHMTADLSNLNLQADEYNGHEQVRVGNGQGLKISHIGASNLLHKHNLSLTHMLHVPQLTKNLISVHRLAHDNNAILEFQSDFFCVKDRATGAILLQGRSRNGLYPLIQSATSHFSPFAHIGERTSVDQCHNRLGHPSSRIVNQSTSCFKLRLCSHKNSTLICNVCQLGKSHCQPFQPSPSVSNFPIALVFCDVWGPSPTLSNNKNRYYVLFVDDYSKFIWVFPIQSKANVFSIFVEFHAHVERLLSCKLKAIQTDGGGEFRALAPYLSTHGILHRLACPYTHQQQGTVERRHRQIVETGLTLLGTSSAPQIYWDEAFVTAAFLINKLPTPVLNNVSPFEKLFHREPDYSFLRVFGCACWPHLRPYNKHKMDFRSKLCVFLGYSLQHHGYECLHIPTS